MVVMSNFYQRIKDVQPATRLKTLIVTNIKEQLRPLTALLFTLVKEKKGGHRVTLANGDVWMKDLLAQAGPRPAVEVSGDDVALLQYSGGTTGLSKGAIATHKQLVANIMQISCWLTDLNPGKEVTLMAIPLFHAYGMLAGMGLGVRAGSTLVMVPNPRDITDLLENINQYAPSLFPGVPALYNAINNNDGVRQGKIQARLHPGLHFRLGAAAAGDQADF